MAAHRRGDDLEPLPVDYGSDWTPPTGRGEALLPGRRRRFAGLGVAAVVVVAATMVAVAVGQHGHRAAAFRRPTGAEINTRPAVAGARVVTALGDQIIARPVTSHGAAPAVLAALRLEFESGLTIDGPNVLVHGTDPAFPPGTGHTGTWAFPSDGSGRPVYLGPSTDFRPSLDSGQVVLTNGWTAWEVKVGDGTRVGPPRLLGGRLVAAVGRGLLVQASDRILCGTSLSDTEVIGVGTALGGQGPYVLWQRADGRLVISDSYTLAQWPTAVALPPGHAPDAATASPDNTRVAAVDGDRVLIGDGVVGTHVIAVSLPSVRFVAWLDDDTLVATVALRGLVTIDAASGVVVREPDFASDTLGLAVITAPRG